MLVKNAMARNAGKNAERFGASSGAAPKGRATLPRRMGSLLGATFLSKIPPASRSEMVRLLVAVDRLCAEQHPSAPIGGTRQIPPDLPGGMVRLLALAAVAPQLSSGERTTSSQSARYRARNPAAFFFERCRAAYPCREMRIFRKLKERLPHIETIHRWSITTPLTAIMETRTAVYVFERKSKRDTSQSFTRVRKHSLSVSFAK